jgi:hypothetical protein
LGNADRVAVHQQTALDASESPDEALTGWTAVFIGRGVVDEVRLVDEIVVEGNTATIKGSYAALAKAIAQKKKGTSEEVPSFMSDWRARRDSNPRPAA